MKKIFILAFILFFSLLLTGCGQKEEETEEKSPTVLANQSILKSSDGSKNYEFKGRIDSKKTIGPVNVLSMAINKMDGMTIYVGTEKNGLYKSTDGGENWKKLEFPLTKIYGLTLGSLDGQYLYAGGLLEKRGKIYRSENGGEKWEEVYSESTDGPVISSLKTLPDNPQVVYAGTTEGAIFKTENNGATWRNIHKASGPVIDISVDAQNSQVIYFGVFQNGVLRTKDGGNTVEETLNNEKLGINLSRNVYAVETDPQRSGVLYVGVDQGIIRGSDFGDKAEAVDILESAKSEPVRALAISPSDPNEITFSSAQAVYKSTDGGKQWAVYQLESTKYVEAIKYDPSDPSNIFLGLRK